MKMYALVPEIDARKSFYNKALVIQGENKITLLSYDSKVCVICGDSFKLNKGIKKELLFSNTTLRHIKEFLFQELDLQNLTKKDLIANVGEWVKVKNGHIQK